MKLRVLLGTLLVITLLAPVRVSASPRDDDPGPAPDGPLRVMIVGDSMTQGQSGSTTYRYWLWREFQAQGVAVTFVGPETGLARGGGANLYNRTDHGFERAHAALAGSRLSFHLGRQSELLERHRPDVVVLQVGFNDSGARDGQRIAADTGTYVERFLAADPDLRVVLGEIVPGGRPFVAKPALRNGRTNTANRLVAERWGGEERVAIAHTRTASWQPWSTERHTFDGAHPNATGETLMAHRMGLALRELGVFSRPVETFHREAWTPAARPRITVRNRTIQVWTGDVRRVVSATSARVVVATAAGRRVWRSPWSRAAKVRATLRPGRYRIWLDVRRERMSGATWSTSIRVPNRR